ncbi:MAG: glycosyltransferase [Nitrospiraceae bacterium]|nr:MAG: glycosyltransferase [Nitrospiraceae bacterium]
MSHLVSILFPVYNGAAYLRESLDSLLRQSHQEFELIIIDDGSRDESARIIQNVNDHRIRFYRQDNRGLAATLNRAIALSRGEYLARQDQDDLSFPDRLEKQLRYLATHPQCGLVGTWAEIVSGTEKTGRVHRHAAENHCLRFDLLFDNPFVHSSVMFRKSAVEAVGMYSTDSSRQPPEDYELWSRLSRKWEVANIPEVLHIYREVPTSMSRDGVSPFRNRVIDISIENLEWLLGDIAVGSVIRDLAALNHAAYVRVSSHPRWSDISRLVIDAADRLAVLCNGPQCVLHERAKAQLAEIKPHYYRFKNSRGVRRYIKGISGAFGRLASGWR